MHLAKQQQVVFREDRVEEAVAKGLLQRTKLEAWFDLNLREFEEARKRHKKGDELCATPGEPGMPPTVLWGWDALTNEYVWPAKELRNSDGGGQEGLF